MSKVLQENLIPVSGVIKCQGKNGAFNLNRFHVGQYKIQDEQKLFIGLLSKKSKTPDSAPGAILGSPKVVLNFLQNLISEVEHKIKDKYLVIVDGKPLEYQGITQLYSRGQAIKKARMFNGKIMDIGKYTVKRAFKR